MTGSRYLPDADATERAGAALWYVLEAPLLVALEGDLGAGKTAFTRGVLRAAGHTGPVPSPTYTLIEPYETRPVIHHLDLYRLGDPEELEFIGLRDVMAAGGVTLVEWPERGRGVLPVPDIVVRIAVAAPGRRIELREGSPSGRGLVERWRERFDVTSKQ